MQREDKIKDASSRSKTLRTFGRALQVFGSGAKAVFAQPMKAARHVRARPNPEAESSNQIATPAVQPPQTTAQVHRFDLVGRELVGSFQQSQHLLAAQLQDSAEFLRRRLTNTGAANGGFLKAGCFPAKLASNKKSSKSSLTNSDEGQDLVSSGSRQLLRIKLYDFAIYLDPKEVKHSQARHHFEDSKMQGSRPKLAKHVRDSNDVAMSLLVRAARNLPIILLSKEYERILKRRLRVVGGSPQDSALMAMMETFREEQLPAEIKQGGSVKKGTVISFTRDHEGNITAKANHHELIRLKSQKLAQAIFDIYLGDQVVSDQARDDTVSSFQKMLKEDAYQPPTSDLICREEVCKIGRL